MISAADAPPVLLVHGTGSTFEHNWVQSGWIDLLADAGRTTVAVHLPGHGPDPEPPDADVADAVLVAAGDGPVDAVGFSAGAGAVLRAAIRRPAAFRRIALLGAGDAMAGLDSSPDSPRGEAIAAVLTGAAEPDPTTVLFQRMVLTSGNDPELVAGFLRAPGTPIEPAGIAGVSAPTLVVMGERDFSRPADALVALLPDARHVIVRGADHFGLTSDFGCLQAVLDFLGD